LALPMNLDLTAGDDRNPGSGPRPVARGDIVLDAPVSVQFQVAQMIGDNEEVVAVRHSELGCSADGRPAVGEAGVEMDEPADPAVLPIGRCGHRMRLFRFLQRTPGVRRARQTAKDSDQCRYGLARLKSCEPQILLT